MSLATTTMAIVAVIVFMVAFTLPTIAPSTSGGHGLGDRLLGLPLPLLRLAEFGYGMLLCRVFLELNTDATAPAYSDLAIAVNLTIIGAIFSMPLNYLWTSVSTVLFGLLICQLASSRARLCASLSTKTMSLLGGASYSIYLLQGPVRAWVKALIHSGGVGELINPIILLALSVLVFFYFEEPAKQSIMRRSAKRAKPSIVQAYNAE